MNGSIGKWEKINRNSLKGSAIILNKLKKLFYLQRSDLLQYLFLCSFKFDDNMMMIFSTPSFILNKYLTLCSTCKSYANQHDLVGPLYCLLISFFFFNFKHLVHFIFIMFLHREVIFREFFLNKIHEYATKK